MRSGFSTLAIGTDLQRFSVFYALWASNLFAAKMEPALTLAIQFVEVAERNDDTVYRLIGYRLIGTMQAYMGRNREALENVCSAPRSTAIPTGQGFSPTGLEPIRTSAFSRSSYCPLPCWVDMIERRESQSRCGRKCRTTNMRPPSPCVISSRSGLELLNADFEACERHSAELVAFCADKKVEQWRLLAAICHALARATLPTDCGKYRGGSRSDRAPRTGSACTCIDFVFVCQLARPSWRLATFRTPRRRCGGLRLR